MPHWAALALAAAHDASRRVPFCVLDDGRARLAGSVAREHLPALRRWPQALAVDDGGVVLHAPAAGRDEQLDLIHRRLREEGLIVAWRDEPYPLQALDDRRLLATIERAASRFWGTLTYGAHCNGWVAGADGRPAALWIARRSPHKATDPGKLDNLIGGGVPLGQSADDCVVREGWEEAGLTPAQMAARVTGGRWQVLRDIPEGLQREEVQVFDLELPPGLVPRNQDGEVAELRRLPIDEALAATDEMTIDAALVTLDFALRHRLLPAAEHDVLQARAAALRPGVQSN